MGCAYYCAFLRAKTQNIFPEIIFQTQRIFSYLVT